MSEPEVEVEVEGVMVEVEGEMVEVEVAEQGEMVKKG